jgi:hypothetical protein
MLNAEGKWNCFSIQLSPITESALLLEGFQAPPVRPSGKGNMYVKMSIEHLWNYNKKGKLCTGRKACPSATLPTANHKQTWLESNTDLPGDRLTTNRLNHDTAFED